MEDILAGAAVGETVEERGFSDELLVAIFEFCSNLDNNNNNNNSGIQYLIYNYKRNNFYPFIPNRSKKSGYRAGDEDTISSRARGQI